MSFLFLASIFFSFFGGGRMNSREAGINVYEWGHVSSSVLLRGCIPVAYFTTIRGTIISAHDNNTIYGRNGTHDSYCSFKERNSGMLEETKCSSNKSNKIMIIITSIIAIFTRICH